MLETLDGQTPVPEGTVALEESSVAVQPAENKDSKIDSIISAAIDKIEGPEPDPNIRTNAAGRAIGADGKFVASKPAEAEHSNEETAKAEAKPAEETTGTVGAKAAETQPLAPHPMWSEADKAIFAKLDPEAQAWALNREKAAEGVVTRKTQELAEQRKAHEPLLNEVSQWSQYLQQVGVAPHEAWRQMLNTERTLRYGSEQDKVNALAYLAQTYGVPLPFTGGEQGQFQPDPAVHQLRSELQSIRQELAASKQAQKEAERQRAEAEFNGLAQTKDDKGELKFPHFERTKQTMLQLVADGLADTWDAAYAKAVRLDDELHNQIVESERKRALEAAEAARKEAVSKANKAKPVVASNSLLNGRQQPKGLDAHINAALDSIGL